MARRKNVITKKASKKGKKLPWYALGRVEMAKMQSWSDQTRWLVQQKNVFSSQLSHSPNTGPKQTSYIEDT